jgi:hypothetical protein
MKSVPRFYDQLAAETAAQRDYLLTAPAIERTMSGGITPQLYQAFLSQAYHHVRHTVPLLMAVGSRLRSDQEWLRGEIVHYVEAGYGHEQ